MEVDRNDSERGAAAVEFAILLLPLVLLIFGTLQFGLAYYQHQALQAGVREGARLAALGGTAGEVEELVLQAACPGNCIWTPTDVTISVSETCPNADEIVEVTASGLGYKVPIPLFDFFDVNLNAKGTFKCEKL